MTLTESYADMMFSSIVHADTGEKGLSRPENDAGDATGRTRSAARPTQKPGVLTQEHASASRNYKAIIMLLDGLTKQQLKALHDRLSQL